jgi:hypothetical protein
MFQQQFLPFVPTFVPSFNDSDLFINNSNCGSIVGPLGPPGPPGPPGEPGLVPVTFVNVTPYNVQLTDYYLAVDIVGPSSIVLPVSPVGTVFVVKDIDGDADTNNIIITAATTIDGSAAATINSPYGSLTFIFNGTEWNII